MPKKLPRALFDADRQTLSALKNLPDYAPANPELGVKELTQMLGEVDEAIDETLRLRNAYFAALASQNTKMLRFHGSIQGARLGVKAQYGKNSPAVRAIGLKCQEDYKRPRPSAAKAEE